MLKRKKSKTAPQKDNWDRLKSALQSMDDTGNGGFEGLIRNLLEAFTGESFILSRAGDQLGDVRAFRGTITVQIKRYRDNTRINDNDIEGEIREIRRSQESLECYVLAASRSVQFKERLERIESDTGLDIVVLEWAGPVSPLGALCVAYWEELIRFPNLELDADLTAWAYQQKNSPEVKQKLALLRTELSVSIHSVRKTRCVAAKALAERFLVRASNRRFPYKIDLAGSIPRTTTEHQFSTWWRNSGSAVAYIEGEEGNGKSWAAARCVWSAVTQGNALVLWYDSQKWRQIASIENLVAIGVESITTDPIARRKLVYKALHVWSGPILLVLDGANEGAASAADKLLQDFSERRPNALRLLFTTRPLENRKDFVPQLWRGTTKIHVAAYNREEFKNALYSLDSTVPPTLFPIPLLDVACIPRYLPTCLKLRTQFGGLENVTKEMVLWEDLLERINSDLQVRKIIGWTSPRDAREILAELALRSTGHAEAPHSLLNECFGGYYDDIRTDLEELKIFEKAEKLRACISGSHLRLGWALLIDSKLQQASASDLSSDQIRSWLEPLASEDNRTEALFIAFQLTLKYAFKEDSCIHLKRAALLATWAGSHNAEISAERLSFCAKADLPAYLDFFESCFYGVESEQRQLSFVKPIVDLWLAPHIHEALLTERLRRWLLLTWSASPAVDVQPVDALPQARTPHHVRLAAIAISLLSLRPMTNLLDSLALCRATLGRSTLKINNDTVQLKQIQPNIDLLIRWGYTESALQELSRLAYKHACYPLMLDGLRRLASSTRDRNLPQQLQLSRSTRNRNLPDQIFERLKQGAPIIGQATHPEEVFFRNIGHLAIRRDFPDQSPSDQGSLSRFVKETCKRIEPLAGRDHTHESGNVEELLPWLAKYRPVQFGELVSELRTAACGFDYPVGLFDLILGTGQNESDESRRRVLDAAYICGNRVATKQNDRCYSNWLIEMVILAGVDAELLEWVNFIAQTEPLRSHSTIVPIPRLLAIRAFPAMQMLAASKLETLSIEPLSPTRRPLRISEFDFWAVIFSNQPIPNVRIYRRIKEWVLANPPGAASFHTILALVAAAVPEELAVDLASAEFRSRIQKLTWYHLWHLFQRAWEPVLKMSYEQLMKSFPQDFVGFLLLKSNRREDFSRWGKELFALATGLCDSQPFVPTHRGSTHFCLDQRGRVRAVGATPPPQTWSTRDANPSIWGVDYADSWAVFQEAPANDRRDLENFQADSERLEHWDHYEIHTFSAEPELFVWAQEHSAEFLDLATRYLDRVPHPAVSQYHLGYFTNSVLNSLLRIDPERAYQYYMSGVSSVNASGYIGTPDYAIVIWERANNAPAHRNVRRRLFEQADHDLEILDLTISALAGDSEDELWELIGEFLDRPSAKDRNLAVAILPWVGSIRARTCLETLVREDPNDWVREHATWALNACIQEIDCRELYERALVEPDTVRVSAYFQQIRPALSKAARFWHLKLEETLRDQIPPSPFNEAIRLSFWSRWQSITNHGTKVYARKLTEFCRGEKLDTDITARLAPWWNPQ